MDLKTNNNVIPICCTLEFISYIFLIFHSELKSFQKTGWFRLIVILFSAAH